MKATESQKIAALPKGFDSYKKHMLNEMEAWYSCYPIDISHMTDKLNAIVSDDMSGYTIRGLIYDVAAEMMDVQLFPHCPFYFEMASGRERNIWGMEGIGGYLKNGKSYQSLRQNYLSDAEQMWDKGMFIINDFLDNDHHAMGIHVILEKGFKGIMADALKTLENESLSEEQRQWLHAVIKGCQCARALGEKFSLKAEQLLAKASANPSTAENHTDTSVRFLKRIQTTASRVPWEAPTTFYEAINTLIMAREMFNTLDGVGICTYGRLDKVLQPYYQADIENGTLTQEEAYELILALISLTDGRWDYTQEQVETSTTVCLGGLNEKDEAIDNQLTRLFFDAVVESNTLNPKINIRVSSLHNPSFYEAAVHVSRNTRSSVSFLNDDVIVPAMVNAHMDKSHALNYVAGGCQEVVAEGSQVSSRACWYLNLSRVLTAVLGQNASMTYSTLSSKSSCSTRSPLQNSADISPVNLGTIDTFEHLYSEVISTLRVVSVIFADHLAGYQKNWKQVNPAPLYSATLEGCMESASDMSAGGARYTSTTYATGAFGTLVDSLLGIKHVVFDEQRMTLKAFVDVLNQNFEDHSALQHYLLTEVPYYGDDSDESNAMAAKLLKEIEEIQRDCRNFTNASYHPTFFSYHTNIYLGMDTPATADGRLSGRPVSRSASPSDYKGNSRRNPATDVHAVKALDYTGYPGAAVQYMTLPIAREQSDTILSAVLQTFVENGGSIVEYQFNDVETLREAQKNPEKYPNLSVRVCGFSAKFTALSKTVQEEVIERLSQVA